MVPGDARELFDSTRRRLANFDVHFAMKDLMAGLRVLRETNDPGDWARFVKQSDEPLAALLHQDPLTSRAFRQPRGYPGDAELMDLLYAKGCLPRETSSLGAAIYGANVQCTPSRVVRYRLDILAQLLDETAEKVSKPHVLSVASGHLREAQQCEAKFAEFYALDRDAETLDVVKREQGHTGITTVNGSVKAVLCGDITFEGLDLIYSAGLYDYLKQPTATALTTKLFSLLKPGGRLVIANFLPGLPESGYMETFMSWHLVYRSDQEIYRLAAEVPPETVGRKRIFHDREGRMAFLDVHRSLE